LYDRKLRQVHLDKAGEVSGQARDVELGQHVADDGIGRRGGGRELGIDKVQRHFHANLAVLVDPLEVDVQHFVLERMHLHVAQQHALCSLAQFHRQYRRVERFLVERVDQGIVVKLDRLRRSLGAAIDDAGRAAGPAQPTARASSFGAARKSGEFELHGDAPGVCVLPCAWATVVRDGDNAAGMRRESFEL
jgi:hypothetical protein